MTQTAKIYGDSLYDLAVEEGITESVFEQSNTVLELFKENPQYRKLLSESSVPRADRLKLMDEAFGQAQPYLLNFLKILCENNLLFEYEGCVEQFKKRYYADRGIAVAKVVSAVALTESQRERLIASLEAKSKKQVILDEKVVPAVLGGIRVELEGITIDGTVTKRLGSMSKALHEQEITGRE